MEFQKNRVQTGFQTLGYENANLDLMTLNLLIECLVNIEAVESIWASNMINHVLSTSLSHVIDAGERISVLRN
jgi:hypothetical protein